MLRTAPTEASAPEDLPLLPGRLGFVYAYVGAHDRMMEHVERMLEAGFGDGLGPKLVWSPAFAPVRITERFKTYVRNIGLNDYWRERGWPDLCHAVGDDDFECD